MKLTRQQLSTEVLSALGDILGFTTGGKLFSSPRLYFSHDLWDKRFCVLTGIQIPHDILRNADFVRGKSIPVYEHLCYELIKAYQRWKSYPDKKEMRQTSNYNQFIRDEKASAYIYSTFVEYAIKTRNHNLHNYFIKDHRTRSYHDQEMIVSGALESSLLYGNLITFNEWMTDIGGWTEASNEYGLLSFYGKEYGTSAIGCVCSINVFDIMRNGHVNSLKFIQGLMGNEGFKKMCTDKVSFYSLAKLGQTKVLDFLVDNKIHKDHFTFAPPFSHLHDPVVFTKLISRYWPKIDVSLNVIWGYFIQHLRSCSNDHKNRIMFYSKVGRKLFTQMIEKNGLDMPSRSILLNRGFWLYVM